MNSALKLFLAAAFLTLCSLAQAQSPSTVLVVANANNASSVALANYYVSQRDIPAGNELLLNLPAQYTPDNVDTISIGDYQSLLAAPIHAKIKTLPHIDYIVLCRNLPVKIAFTPNDPNAATNDDSVDSVLAINSTTRQENPYWHATQPFNSTTYHMYLVTRLDGWSWADANALVDRSIAAEKGAPIFLNAQPQWDSQAVYNQLDYNIVTAYNMLHTAGDNALLEDNGGFTAPAEQLGGYYSWGSNDDWTFSAKVFSSLEFAPGAIAETIVSTSAINLRYPQPGMSNGGAVYNQSQIAVLIRDGVTGVKGYVAEPKTVAIADPRYLFPNYVSGRNLAESFYSASILVGWKDVVVGDPLCNPYEQH